MSHAMRYYRVVSGCTKINQAEHYYLTYSYNFDCNKRYIMFHESACSGVAVFSFALDSVSSHFARGLWELYDKICV